MLFSACGGEFNVLFMGSTGTGKSASVNLASESLGGGPVVLESNGAFSYTHDITSVIVKPYRLIDSPGLLDTGGIKVDEENIEKIVTYVKNLKKINGFFLVLNFQSVRLDDGILNAIKLYVDSFGKEFLSRMCFVFTRALRPNVHTLAERAHDFSALINSRCESNYNFPFYYVECHPEQYSNIGITTEMINLIKSESLKQINNALEWASGKTPYSTIDAVFGQYEQVRAIKEKERIEKEARYNASVIERKEETRTVTIPAELIPIYVDEEKSEWVPDVWLGVIKSGGRYKRWTEKKLVGSQTKKIIRKEKREVLKYGSGKVHYGNWVQYGNEQTVIE